MISVVKTIDNNKFMLKGINSSTNRDIHSRLNINNITWENVDLHQALSYSKI